MSQGGQNFWMSKRRRGEDGSDDWMITYADAVTLVLTFFVLLLSISTVDPNKYEAVKSAIVGEVSRVEPSQPYTRLAENLEQIIVQERLNEVEMRQTGRGLTLEFAGTTLYEPGSATLKPQAKEILAKVARNIRAIPGAEYQVVVEGHTDDVPINTPQFPSNWELSTQRATNVVRYLIQEGLPPYRLLATGLADTRPKAPNRDHRGQAIPENQAKNRRVVIEVTPPGSSMP